MITWKRFLKTPKTEHVFSYNQSTGLTFRIDFEVCLLFYRSDIVSVHETIRKDSLIEPLLMYEAVTGANKRNLINHVLLFSSQTD